MLESGISRFRCSIPDSWNEQPPRHMSLKKSGFQMQQTQWLLINGSFKSAVNERDSFIAKLAKAEEEKDLRAIRVYKEEISTMENSTQRRQQRRHHWLCANSSAVGLEARLTRHKEEDTRDSLSVRSTQNQQSVTASHLWPKLVESTDSWGWSQTIGKSWYWSTQQPERPSSSWPTQPLILVQTRQ